MLIMYVIYSTNLSDSITVPFELISNISSSPTTRSQVSLICTESWPKDPV